MHRSTLARGIVPGLAAAVLMAVLFPFPAAAGESANRPTSPVSGVTISWDLESQRFHAPTPAQAVVLAEELARYMEEVFAAGETALAPAGELEVRTLPSGATMVRIPARLFNASVVRIDGAGEERNLCVDGPARAAAALRAPATGPVEVR